MSAGEETSGLEGEPEEARAAAHHAGGVLHVVATPIGNLDDITVRALAVLRACDRVAAEDTRRTRALLTHFGISGKPVEALHAHSDAHDVARLAGRVLGGENVALVTDAGTPVVSDPGDAVVRAVLEGKGRVVPIPGASAVLAALVGSGLANGHGFRFVGFLPRQGRARGDAIAAVCATPEPTLLFESPNRTAETLAELAAATPERAACVARELTKLHEEFVRGTLASLAQRVTPWLGEVVIVLGAHEPDAREAAIDDAALDARIEEELAAGGGPGGGGVHAKTLAERLAAWSGRPKRDVYARVVALRASRR